METRKLYTPRHTLYAGGIINLPYSVSTQCVHFHIFLPFLHRGTNFVTDWLFSWITKPFQNGSTLRGKNLLLEEQILSYESRLSWKGRQNENGIFASSERVSVDQKLMAELTIAFLKKLNDLFRASMVS